MKNRLLSDMLLPASWLYAFCWRAYLAIYQAGLKKRWRPPIPVVGVGSLEVGGSGKTPLALAIVRVLEKHFKKVAISVYGYRGSRSNEVTLLGPFESVSVDEFGDEAVLIKMKAPHIPMIVSRHRVQAVKVAMQAGCDAIVLDDGFQHLPLARWVDLLVLNLPIKNRRYLPAGPLREPWSGWRRADGVLVSGEKCSEIPLPQFRIRRVFKRLIALQGSLVLPVEWLRGREVSAACAIGKPFSFLHTLQQLGAEVKEFVVEPDHRVLSKLPERRPLVITEKDAVKFMRESLPMDDVYALEMDVCVDDEFFVWLMERLRS